MTSFKWGSAPQSRTVAFYHRRVSELVQERLAASGKTWEDAVWDPDAQLTTADFQKLEDELLATGIKFAPSAGVSVAESPDKYEAAAVEIAEAGEADEQGRIVVGGGDNVFATKEDVIGTAMFVSSVEKVMDLLDDGVPDGTVAVIDDSGGTLTAPILEEFTAVICKGGSVRSHLGILTREYAIPCLMAAEVSGLSDGDRVQVEYSAPAKSPYEKEDAGKGRVRVWKLA